MGTVAQSFAFSRTPDKNALAPTTRPKTILHAGPYGSIPWNLKGVRLPGSSSWDCTVMTALSMKGHLCWSTHDFSHSTDASTGLQAKRRRRFGSSPVRRESIGFRPWGA